MDLRLDLAGGLKRYYAESFRSDALLERNAIYTRNTTESVGAISVTLYCGLNQGSDSGLKARAGSNPPYITARLLEDGGPDDRLPAYRNSATGTRIPGKVGTIQAIVAGQSHRTLITLSTRLSWCAQGIAMRLSSISSPGASMVILMIFASSTREISPPLPFQAV